MTSTLSAAFTDLQGAVGHFAGYGRGEDNGDQAWTATQQADITEAVKSGMRKFYHCGHDWSFLKPVATLTLASGANTIILPDDLGGVEGRIAVSISGGTSTMCFLSIGNIGAVYENEARYASRTGHPELCCVEPLKGTGRHEGQKQKLHVWPTADQAYTFKFQYYLNPDYLTGSLPYAYGGPQHAETLLAACKAAFERDVDDILDGTQEQNFQRHLQQSIDMDRRLKPQGLGYNWDRSDDVHHGGLYRSRMDQTITLAGMNPDD